MNKLTLAKIYTIALLLVGCVLAVNAGERDRLFYAYDASNGLADNSAQIVMCTKTGRIMITTIGHVNFFDGSTFTHIDPKASDAVSLPGFKGKYQIYFDHFHHLWLKNNGLMTCVNLTTEQFVPDVYREIREMGMKKPVDDLYGDGECNLWFRSGRYIYCQEQNKKFAVHSSVPLQDVDLYNDSLLLMFHADGTVAVNDYKRNTFLYADSAFNSQDAGRYTNSSELCLVGNRYYQLRSSRQESVLISYDIDGRQWTRLLATPFLMNSVYPWNDKLYIGSERGYLVYDLLTGQAEHIEELQLTKGRSQIANINSLTFDRQGGMWIGTQERGLLYAKSYPSPFKAYDHRAPEYSQYLQLMDRELTDRQPLPRKVNCIYTDSRGWKWTGTYTGLTLELPNGQKRVFSSRDGMTNEVIHSVMEDDQHDIWASSSFGIFHLFIRDGKVIHLEPYTNQDNIPNESFLNGRVVKLDDGTIVMQSLDHVVAFNPTKFQGARFGSMVLYPKLIRLMVNGMPVEPNREVDGRIIIDRSVSRVAEFSVNYNQNSLGLTFSGLNYLRPLQTYYRVRVKGVAAYNDWRIFSFGKSNGIVDKHGMLHLPLLGLEPGTYQIELQASLWPETWPQEPFVWIIHVEQPWWRTTGLYLTLGFILLLLLVANFLVFNRNTRLRLLCNNEEADILHRIRTFAARCESMAPDQSAPASSPLQEGQEENNDMSSPFIEAMARIVPYVNAHRETDYTVDDLAAIAGIEKKQLYNLLSDQIDRSPRQLVSHLHLQKASPSPKV